MEATLVPDNGGKTLRFWEVEGRYYPFRGDHQTFIDGAKAIARTDDILLCTYPKSGTNWIGLICIYLIEGTTDDDAVQHNFFLLEFETIAGMEARRSPRPIPTHYATDRFSTDFLRKKSKIIYVTRDPRDVAVSFFNHHKKLVPLYQYDGEWNDYFPLFMEGKVDYGSWFEHTKGWEKLIKDNSDHPFLVLTYEDMKKDPKGGIKKLSEFIGCNHSDDFLEEVFQKTSFDSMKERQEAGKGTPIQLRKGVTGDWKNWFTVTQSEKFNEAFEREMPGTKAYELYSHKHLK